ncbi:MAG: polyprenol monophosphomannose synthase [Chloroflexi bacterium]|nr:polyprenol monophosphomannose synthase [Chloroflexota bacterium]
MQVTVVMPTYDEAQNLPPMVERLFSLGISDLRVLVVDDNSPDGTGEVAEALKVKYPCRLEVIHRQAKKGLGTAYLQGFKWALEQGADAIVEMDTDFSHPTECLHQFLECMRDYDVVVGSRYVSGGRVDPHWGWWRRFLSWGGNVYARWVTGLQVRDATAGFKCFSRRALEGLDLSKIRSDGYAFQVEVAYACQKKGYRVAELPIFFTDRTSGKSKMSLKIVWEAWWRVWQMKWRYRHEG